MPRCSQRRGGRGRDSPSQAGAKPAAKLDIMKSSRARRILSILRGYPPLQGIIKINFFCTQIPRWQDITITYYLLYTSYVFMVPKPPKISIFWYPKGGKPAAKQLSWSQDAKMQPEEGMVRRIIQEFHQKTNW